MLFDKQEKLGCKMPQPYEFAPLHFDGIRHADLDAGVRVLNELVFECQHSFVGGVRNIMPALQRFKALGTLEPINRDRVDIPPEGFDLIGQMRTPKQMWFRSGLVPQDQLDFLRKELPTCNISLHH